MHLLNDETIQAICWTLIYTPKWQGSLLAARRRSSDSC